MSAINIFSIDCSSITCPSGALGAMDLINQDCNDNIVQSEVNSLIWWHPELGTGITNWGPSLATGDFDIDNTDATDAKQKRIFGQGDLSAPDYSTVTTNNFNVVDLPSTYTLNFDIFDVGGDSYDYLRKLQCSKVKPAFVFTTVGGKVYGDGSGIAPTMFRLSPILERGEESVEKWSLVLTWKAHTAPDRQTNPLP